MQRIIQCLVVSLLACMFMADYSHAGNSSSPWQTSGYQNTNSYWGEPPLSCVPYRAAKWNDEGEKALCHCPPQSMCPTSVAEFNNNPKVPPYILNPCCDIACPRGTAPEFTFVEKKVKTGEAARVAGRMNVGISARASDVLSGVNTRAQQGQGGEEGGVIPGCDWPPECAGVDPEGDIPPYCAGYWVSKHGEWIVNDDPNIISSACIESTCHPDEWPAICKTDVASALELSACDGYWEITASGAIKMTEEARAINDECEATTGGGGGTPPGDGDPKGDDPVGCEGLDGCEVEVVDEQTILVPQLKCTPINDNPCDKITTLTDPHADPSEWATVPSISCTIAEAFCVLEGTDITMSDGSTKNVEDLRLGDKLLSGSKKQVTVTAVSRVIRRNGALHSINGSDAFITAEHPILTTDGWKSIAPNNDLQHSIKIVGALELGDEIVTLDGNVKVTSIEAKDMESDSGIATYNMIVDGDGTFVADGLVVKSMRRSAIYY